MTHIPTFNKFSISVGNTLLVELSGCDGVFKTSVVGLKSPEYVIFEIPRTTDFDRLTNSDNTIIGASICSGTVIRFKCSILQYMKHPIPLIVASFPKSFGGRQLRKTSRVECNVPATLRLYHGIALHDGLIVDISSGGCKYVANSIPRDKLQRLHPGVKVGLSFQFLGAEGQKNITGDIVSVNRESKRITIGVKFHKAEDEVLEKIAIYVETVVKSSS